MDKRYARSELKLKKTLKGVFTVRCTVSGEVWMCASDHLDSAQIGLWFLLRNGLHDNKTLQRSWNAHGEQAFQYDIVETLDEDASPRLLKLLFRERQKYWQGQLKAAII